MTKINEVILKEARESANRRLKNTIAFAGTSGELRAALSFLEVEATAMLATLVYNAHYQSGMALEPLTKTAIQNLRNEVERNRDCHKEGHAEHVETEILKSDYIAKGPSEPL